MKQKMSLQRRRKLNGYVEFDCTPNLRVLSRNYLHEKISRKILYFKKYLITTFILIGFFLVYLPNLNNEWKEYVLNTLIGRNIYYDYNNFTGLFAIHLFSLTPFYIIFLSLEKQIPKSKHGQRFTRRECVELAIYPKTKKQEFTFWFVCIFELWTTSGFIFVPFGLLSQFTHTN